MLGTWNSQEETCYLESLRLFITDVLDTVCRDPTTHTHVPHTYLGPSEEGRVLTRNREELGPWSCSPVTLGVHFLLSYWIQ